MSFGKRNELPQPRHGERSLPVIPGRLSYERIEALHLALVQLLKDAGLIATAIREQGIVHVPAIAQEPDPDAGPIPVKPFVELFAFLDNERITHAILALADTAHGTDFDTIPQVRLAELMGRIRELNLFCQQAELDDALRVALQSPHLPALMDEILGEAAWLTTFADQVIAALPPDERPLLAGDEATTTDGALPERYYLMAADMMLDPSRIERLGPLPGRDPILRPVLLPIAPHAGDYFINGIYLPAPQAADLIARHESTADRAMRPETSP